MAGPCEYVVVFKPLWLALTIYAAWPQKVTKGGRLVRSLCSVRVVFTGLLFCVSCWRSWETLLYHINFHLAMPPGNLPLRLLNIQYSVYLVTLGIVAGFILEGPRSAEYAARWHEFQPELQRVCGKAMRNDGLRRRVKLTAVALSVGWPTATIVTVLYAGSESQVTVEELLFQSYITTVFTLASTNWRMHCAFFLHASSMLVDALVEALEGDSLTGRQVVRFARAWLRLYDLVNDGVRSCTFTTLLDLFILTTNMVLCTFNTMYVIFNGFSKLGIFLTMVGFLTILTLTRIFNAAHRVNDELWTRAVLALAKARVSKLPEETLREVETLRLILKTHPLRLALLGFLPVDRNVCGGILVTVSTYLIVLIQFTIDG